MRNSRSWCRHSRTPTRHAVRPCCLHAHTCTHVPYLPTKVVMQRCSHLQLPHASQGTRDLCDIALNPTSASMHTPIFMPQAGPPQGRCGAEEAVRGHGPPLHVDQGA